MKRALRVALAAAVLLAAAVFASNGSWPWRRLTDVAPPVAAPVQAPPVRIASDTLRSGEALGDLFGRHGIGALDLTSVLDLLGLDPRRVKAGLVFRFAHPDSTDGSTGVMVRTRPDEEMQVIRAGDRWTAERRPIRWASHLVRVEGKIETSLYDALTEASISEPLPEDDRIRLAWDLADVFAWTVDFTRDLQPDDRFVVVFEREVSERGETRLGAITASLLEVGHHQLTAFRFETGDGRSQYFDEDGTSLRRAFLRAPVEFRRVASGFSRSRFHPILGIWRRHEGIDYAAASGTPVEAAAEGTVVSAGWAGGYGRMIEIRHGNGISTRYAHLRAFAPGIRPGARVHQGDTIGFVGASGLATAPHLHYEFRQNGAARDPSRVDLGNGEPVPSDERPAFQASRDRFRPWLFHSPPAPDSVVAGGE